MQRSSFNDFFVLKAQIKQRLIALLQFFHWFIRGIGAEEPL